MTRNIFITFLLISNYVAGQVTEYETYDWNTIPEIQLSDSVKPVNGVKITFERRVKEVYLNKNNYFEEINVLHRKIRVETDDAIDNNNKIYIPVNDVLEIIAIKARFISPTGKVTEVPQKSIKELENLENKGNFRVFAIEGAEIGGEIEYYYTLRNSFNAYGTMFMQTDEPKTNVEVLFKFPSKLEYLIKSYNGLPDFTTVTDTTGITRMKMRADVIPPLSDEKYAHYNANKMRFEYTLAYNRFNSLLRIYTWSKVSNNIYKNVYQISSAEASAVKKELKVIGLKEENEEQKIRKIEDWIKSEIAISDAMVKTPSIDQILKFKQTSKYGATRLFVAMLNEATIPFELVMACKTSQKSFDPDFNGWNYLDDYLIYFDDLNEFIAPDDPVNRLGVMPVNYQDSYALFLHPVKYNDKLGTLAYNIKKLPAMSVNESVDSLMVEVNFDFSKLNADIKIQRILTGILAYSFQGFWESVNNDRRLEIIRSVFDMGDNNTTIRSYTIENGSITDVGLKPFICNVDLTANTMIEIAGNDFIVNIGRTIGQQTELYQTQERKMPVDIDYAHHYYREIRAVIPEGYTVSNLDNLNMKVEMTGEGKPGAYFISWYKMAENTLYIYSKEVYPDISYPVDRFEEFRQVINAAANFNKKTLLLTPVK